MSKCCYRIIPLLLLTALFTGVASDTPGDAVVVRRWAEQLWKNPQRWFSDAYEKAIFEHFHRKFPAPDLQHAERNGEQRLVQLDLGKSGDPYLLVFETSQNNRIRKVGRFFPQISKGQLDAIPGAAEWIGQFIYRIDAGDSAAIMDLLFFREVEVDYRHSRDKNLITRQLLRDFPGVLQPREFTISSSGKRIEVRIDTPNLQTISINLPEHLPGPEDTAWKQDKLFQRLQAATTRQQHRVKPYTVENIIQQYPGARQHQDSLHLPYLTERVSKLPEMLYLVRPEGDGVVQIDPQITLSAGDAAAVLFNRKLPVALFGSADDFRKSLPELQEVLEDWYRLLVFPNREIKNLRGSIQYRGYEVRDIPLEKSASLGGFIATMLNEGTPYLYPTRIDVREESSEIRGIIYIVDTADRSGYHFMEWKLLLRGSMRAIRLVCYPYIRSGEVVQFEESL